MSRKKSLPIFFSITAVIILILTVSGISESGDLKLYDFFLGTKIAHSPRPLNSRIVQIDLNDLSDNELTEEINSRKAFADVMEVLGSLGVSSAFDFIWQRPGPNDAAMAKAASYAWSMVFSAAPVPLDYANTAFDNMKEEELDILSGNLWNVKEFGRGRIPRARSFIMSNPEISAAATSIGHIGVENDSDRVYRRIPLFYRWQYGLIPCLALALAAEELMIDVSAIELHHGKELVLPIEDEKPIRIPINDRGEVIIPYASLWQNSGPRFSFMSIANAKYDDETYMDLMNSISGQIAIVADTTTAKRDFGINPAENVYPLSGIQSALLSAILDEYFYYTPGIAYRIIIMAILAGLAFAIYLLKKDAFFHLSFLLLTVIFVIAISILWFNFRIIPWMSIPLTAVFVLWLLDFSNRLFIHYREKYRLELTFSRYLSPELVKTISSDPQALKLGGQKKIMTALFTDLENFTALAEEIDDPEKLTTLLNLYLSGMSDIILENRGTIDKYEGDAIISFFGAPVHQKNHAELACRSAVLMKQREDSLNTEIREKLLSPRPLYTRFGINTGDMLVGNLGTIKKMDYTIMGTSVNLASRLEGVNKQYHTRILISDYTKKTAGNSFVSRRLDRVRVMGINVPVLIWELLEIGENASSGILELAEKWEEAITEYEKRNYPKARDLFFNLEGNNPGDKTVKLFKTRCENFLLKPPLDDWDGVINLTSK